VVEAATRYQEKTVAKQMTNIQGHQAVDRTPTHTSVILLIDTDSKLMPNFTADVVDENGDSWGKALAATKTNSKPTRIGFKITAPVIRPGIPDTGQLTVTLTNGFAQQVDQIPIQVCYVND
jgi:hypothetical protein